MQNSSRKNLFVPILNLSLIGVFVSVLLFGFTAALFAKPQQPEAKKSENAKEMIIHPHLYDGKVTFPDRARPRSPFKPGKHVP